MQTTKLARMLALVIACAAAARAHAGSVQFIESGQSLGNDATTAVALGDIDGDGDIDAVSPTYVGPILVRLNQGDGTFVPGETIQDGSLSGNLALRDLDGDGDLDIFIVNHSFSTTVYFNDGDGTFTPSGQFLNSASSHGLAMGDIDGDGDIDAFITDIAGHYNAPILNNGSGFFVYGASNSLPPARDVDLGDLNGDGRLDVFLAQGSHGSNDPAPWPDRVFFGDGAGGFVDSGQRLDSQASTDVRLGDLDGDGDLDAMVANSDSFGSDPANRVYFNDGSGGFTDSGQAVGVASSFNISLGDIDLDGDRDAIVSNGGPDLDEIWLNDGSGGFAFDGEFGVVMQGGKRIAELADLDGDGDLDIFTVAGGMGDRVYLNQTIVKAELLRIRVPVGERLTGGLPSLHTSDNIRLRIHSEFRFTSEEVNIVDLNVDAVASGPDPAALDLRIEARSDTAGGKLRLRLRNWTASRWDTVRQFPLPTVDTVRSVEAIAASDYVRQADGQVRLSLRSTMLATFSSGGFIVEHDEVAVLVR